MKPGIYFNIPEQEYRKAPGICQSDLKECRFSMAHYRQKILEEPKEPTPDMELGTLVHRLILEGKAGGYAIRPEGLKLSTKEGKEWRKDNPGLVVDFDPMLIRDAVMANPDARNILAAKGDNEVSCWKEHEETGLLLKGRADRVTTDNAGYTVVADIKTVPRGEADAKSFQKAILKWGYHIQAAFYRILFEFTYFVFIVVEKEPPFSVGCYTISAAAMAEGDVKIAKWLPQIKQCQDSGIWPGPTNGMQTIDLPDWYRSED